MNLLIERAAQKPDGRTVPIEPERELQNYVVREFLEGLYGMADLLRHSAVGERTFEQAMLGEFSPVRLANEVNIIRWSSSHTDRYGFSTVGAVAS
jgi:hypothetical protein